MEWNDATLSAWQNAKYDGIKGLLPEWVPEPAKETYRLSSTIMYLTVAQKRASLAELKKRFKWVLTDDNARLVIALSKTRGGDLGREYDAYLFQLVDIYKAVSKGLEKGIQELAGSYALKGYKSANAYKMRDDAQDKPIFQGHFRKNRSVIRSLRDLDAIPDLRPYQKKYKPQTLRDWINEIAPGHLRRGKPKKR